MQCSEGKCRTPIWMNTVLAAAGVYCLGFAVLTFFWPSDVFEFLAAEKSKHHVLVQIIGLFYTAFGLSFFLAARDPIRHWRIVLVCTAKISLVVAASVYGLWFQKLPPRLIFLLCADDFIWLVPFVMILWAALQAKTGRPLLYAQPLSVAQACDQYRLSSGETLSEAMNQQLVVLVFLRHFGCTFTRQLLRGLELLESQATMKNGRLVLVHMLQSGSELSYLGERSGLARIADPYCELYRTFGLGKAGFWELFGPRVWYRGMMALFRGCGVGHLAGDGLQMPGVFLLHEGKILARQPAHSAADLPDLEALFHASHT